MLNSTIRQPWVREFDGSVENPDFPSSTPRCRPGSSSERNVKAPLTALQFLQEQQFELQQSQQRRQRSQQLEQELGQGCSIQTSAKYSTFDAAPNESQVATGEVHAGGVGHYQRDQKGANGLVPVGRAVRSTIHF